MKREITLVAEEDPEFGELGWKLPGMSELYNYTSYAQAVSHDIFEHLNGFEDVADEMIAHGVLYWLRSNFEPDASPYSIGKNEVYDLVIHYNNEQRVHEPKLDSNTESELRDIVRAAFEAARAEFPPNEVRIALRPYLSFLRRGYRLAGETYGKIGRLRTYNAFLKCKEFFAKNPPENEGDRVKFSLDLLTGECILERIFKKKKMKKSLAKHVAVR